MASMQAAENPQKRTRGRPRAFDRDAALDGAMRLFWEKGYEAASVDALGAAMGIGPSSLYAAFGDKARLFQAAIERYENGPGAFRTAILAEAPSAREAVEGLLRAAAEAFTRPGLPSGCMVGLIAAAAPQRRALQAAVKGRLDRAMKSGELAAATDAAGLAAYFTAVLHGLSVQARDGADARQLSETARLAMRAWPAEAQVRRHGTF
jgi:AcrR family transcriptional regulator